MATRAWNANDPAGSDAANTIDNATQRIRQDVIERLVQGGFKIASITPPVSSANENSDGRPAVGYETQSHQDDTGYLTIAWKFDGTTYMVRQYGTGHATQASQFEIPGDLVNAGPIYLIKGGKAVGAFLRAIIGDPTPLATKYLKRVAYKVPSFSGAPGRTLQKVKLVVGTKPAGSDLVVTVRKLAAPADSIDRFNDTNSTQVASTTLTAASGNFSAESTALGVALATDDELVVKYGATDGSAADLTVILQIE